ncbi:MAG: glycerol-3-phosphate dehydrogenase, partial [Thermoproteota archaeon]|nr:glycerol-3-phosphate dehydrogenase [Thermoproteota archaeon]
IIHAGFDDKPGTLKAKLCSRGNILWSKLAYDLDIPLKRIGSLVVALNEDEVGVLKELRKRGNINGVPDLEIIEDHRKLTESEPNLNETARAALLAPTAGIVSPYDAAIALAENTKQNGTQIMFETNVLKIIVEGNSIRGVHTNKGLVEADYVVNAAGLFSDEISRMVGVANLAIVPQKGEYFVFDKSIANLVNHVLFPVPTEASKGIVVTRTVDGNLLIGPNANSIYDKADLSTTRSGLDEVFEGALKLVPSLCEKKGMAIANYAGLRAVLDVDDFVIKAYDELRGFINLVGIKSPGLTSSPAIAEMVAHLLDDTGLELRFKEDFYPTRKSIDRSIRQLLVSGTANLIARDPLYGHVVCRCEQVTEGEVVEAIKRGATTLDGIKYRTRAGMGRCQGGFCTPHIVRIISRELDLSVNEVTKHGGDSKILPYEAKALLQRGMTENDSERR